MRCKANKMAREGSEGEQAEREIERNRERSIKREECERKRGKEWKE